MARVIDLLKSDVFARYIRTPNLLHEELVQGPSSDSEIVILDEVQKIPLMLDEVHWLIENTPHHFVLCG